MDSLSQNAESPLLREQVKQYAMALTDNLNTTAARLYEYQEEQDNNISVIVNEINTIGSQIASLNESIFKFELSGSKANDLRDERNQLVDELSSLADVTTNEAKTGEFTVKINGMTLVSHTQANNIVLKNETVNSVTGSVYSTPYWEGSNVKLTVSSGSLKAALDVRDGNSAGTPGINYYISMMDNLAGSLVQEFNSVNKAGYTLPYGSNVSGTGVDFFNPANVNAYNISLSDEMLEDSANIAASSASVSGYDNWSNSENLSDFLSLWDSDSVTYNGVSIGNFSGYMKSITTGSRSPQARS